MIGRLEELARKLGDRGDEVIADFYMGKIGYQEALKKLQAMIKTEPRK